MAGKVAVYVFEENLNEVGCERILRTLLVPTLNHLHPHGRYLQHDNLRAHSSRDVTAYLCLPNANVVIEVILWPSYSLDLNPLENL